MNLDTTVAKPRARKRASTARSGVPGASYVEALRRQSRLRAQHTALIFLDNGEREADRLSFGDLDARAMRFAALLQSRGLSGQAVMLVLPSSVEYVVALLGCLYAGAVAVPAYPHLHGLHIERLAQMADDCGVRAVVHLQRHAGQENLRKRFEAIAPGLRDGDFLAVDDLPPPDGEAWVDPDLGTETLALLQYTSGSTGRPRGVMVTHGNLLANARLTQSQWGGSSDDVFLTWLPLYHDMGIGSMLFPLYSGATNVFMPPHAFLQKPMRWLEAMSRYRATFNVSPNFAFDICLGAADASTLPPLDLSAWQVAGNGSEPIRPEILRRFSERFGPCGFRPETHMPGYGLAETTMGVTFTPRGSAWRALDADADALLEHRLIAAGNGAKAKPVVDCGRADDDTRILVVDPETLKVCHDGAVGEIWVAGPTVAAGYWNRPEETQQTFHARTDTGDGPFLRTGDLGALRDGRLYVTGRRKDLIVIRGSNHYPQDIEQSVLRSTEVLEADRGAAFSVDDQGEERLVVVQEVRRAAVKLLDATAAAAAIRQAVLAAHGIHPHAILLLKPGSVPLTSSGKIQRQACKADYLADRFEPLHAWQADAVAALSGAPAVSQGFGPASYEAVSTWLRDAIARKKRLAPDSISLDAPFVSFGLDSLEIVALSGELSTRLDRDLSPTLVYDYPTPRLFAEKIAGKPASQAAVAAPSVGKANALSPLDTAVAIVGMACRFPGANSLDAYWEVFASGKETITEVPSERWPVNACHTAEGAKPGKRNTSRGGLIDRVDEFDAAFFNIAPIEAESMDPQQRVLLSVMWHALEDAGIPAESLAGGNAGVFVGVNTLDYRQLLLSNGAATAHAGTGNGLCMCASRISYFLDVHGPSVAIDTACSSSLVAVHQARASLLVGECDVAIVGGVNLILAPDNTVAFANAGLLSPDGRCKAFDADANGYVRSEGCGVVILKRHADALRDGDHVRALVAGSAVNQDGRSNGIAAPNGLAQRAVIKQALASAGVEAGQVSYVEAQGTGTNLGDAIEMDALKEVYGGASDAAPTLWVGTAKTNIGHLEPASGVAALIRTVLMLRHGQVPPHLHLQQLNPLISLADSRVAIPSAAQDWQVADGAKRIAGVSAFGIGGANAHVIVREATANVSVPTPAPIEILTLSAKSKAALTQLASDWAQWLAGEGRDVSLAALCHTANSRRSHHAHRFAMPVASVEEARDGLRRFAHGEAADDAFSGFASEVPGGGMAIAISGDGDGLEQWRQIARSYVVGGLVDWQGRARARAGSGMPPAPPVALPAYPFQAQRYWFSPSRKSAAVGLDGFAEPSHPLLGRRLDLANVNSCHHFENLLAGGQPGYVSQHRLFGTAVLPAAALVNWMMAAASAVRADTPGWLVENLAIKEALAISGDAVRIQSVVTEGGAHFDVRCLRRDATAWQELARATVKSLEQGESATKPGVADRVAHLPAWPLATYYEQLAQAGLEYGPLFRGLQQVWRDGLEAIARISVSQPADDLLQPLLLDACFHVIGCFGDLLEAQRIVLPVAMRRFEAKGQLPNTLWCHVRWQGNVGPGRYEADFALFDEAWTEVARIEGLQFADVSQDPAYAALFATLLGGEPAGWQAALAEQARMLIAGIGTMETGDAKAGILDYLFELLSSVMRLDETQQGELRPVFDQVHVNELGVDSLMGVQLRNHVLSHFGVDVPVQLFVGGSSAMDVVDLIYRESVLNQLTATDGDDGADGSAATEEFVL